MAVLAERLVISVTPMVSGAALTFRSLMPIVPLFAIVAGGGLWAAAGVGGAADAAARSARGRLRGHRRARLVIASGRRCCASDFRASRCSAGWPTAAPMPTRPQGLRVEALVAAAAVAASESAPTDVILTAGIPRQLAWYADLGVDGMNDLIDLGLAARAEPSSNSRALELQRQYILDRVGPRGVDYVVDFNVNWIDPGGDNARQWRQTFELLRSQPNLEVAVRRERQVRLSGLLRAAQPRVRERRRREVGSW